MKLLYLGRLSVEKGVDVLLSALGEIGETTPISLSICGDGPQRAPLEQMAKTLGLDQRVRFNGFVSEIEPLLLEADILVMPSRTEGLPMALIEAAACGKPVVASQVGGIPEIVIHEKNGLLVPPEDINALAGALKQMATDLYEYKLMGTRKALEIRREYSAENWAVAALKHYKTIIHSKEHLVKSQRVV